MQKSRGFPLPELVSFVVYLTAYVIMTQSHEPWFDEAQAWQIARCGSLYEILFEIPHYEGHPPLWYLVLVPLAKLGVPFELGLKAIGFTLSGACVYFILFRSPFPRAIRLLLPFNYFIFFQYGVIVRPYMLLFLWLLLLALCFETRNEHPMRFVSLLALLCFTHAYGMLIAAGIALAFTIEIVHEKGFRVALRELCGDRRTRALCMLLVVGIGMALCIVPRADTYNQGLSPDIPLALRLIYMFMGLLGECFLVCSPWFTNDRALIQIGSIPIGNLVSTCLIGALFWVGVFSVSSKQKLKYFFIPYAFLAAFGAIVYFAAHHVGVAMELLVFWLWIDLQDPDRFAGARFLKAALKPTISQIELIERCGMVAVMLCLCIPLYWSVASSYRDVMEEYGTSRGFAEFLVSHRLDDLRIFNAWLTNRIDAKDDEKEEVNTYLFGDIATLQAYFDKPIFSNVEDGYLHYKVASDAYNERNRKSWERIGVPEMLLGKVDLEWVFGDEVTEDDYELIYIHKSDHAWKGIDNITMVPVYLRKDLLEQYGLEPLELSLSDTLNLTGELELPQDMVDSLRKGDMTMDEFLDEMGLVA